VLVLAHVEAGGTLDVAMGGGDRSALSFKGPADTSQREGDLHFRRRHVDPQLPTRVKEGDVRQRILLDQFQRGEQSHRLRHPFFDGHDQLTSREISNLSRPRTERRGVSGFC